MAIRIEQRYLDEMIDHAKADYPNEACGIIAGQNGKPKKLYRARNAENSPVLYSIDPLQQLEIMQEIEKKGWDLYAIFHSHTHSAAYPSHTDVRLAYYSDAHYFIVSLMNKIPIVRAFRIVDGKIREEEIEVK